jgi:hypothetical protein
MVLAVLIVIAGLTLVGYWKMFIKAGYKGWAALVPFYNTAVMLEMTGKPLWWMLLFLIPGVNLVCSIILLHRLAMSFGKGWGFTLGLLFLPFIFFPILGLGSSQYRNDWPPAPPMSEPAKWTFIAVGAFLLMETFSLSLSATGNTGGTLTILADGNGGSSGYATDGRFVYYNDMLVSGADALSFRLAGDYALDDYAVYYGGMVVQGADARTFHALNGGVEYGADDSQAYYYGDVIPGADPATFYALDQYYAKDAGAAYFSGSAIAGADVSTFSVPLEAQDSEYALDATHVYFDGAVVSGADPATFETGFGRTGNASYDAKDARHLYMSGEIVR